MRRFSTTQERPISFLFGLMEGFNCFEKNSQCVPQDVPNSIKLFFSPYALAKVELSYIYNYNNKISAKGKHLYASRVCGMRPIKVAPYKSIPLGAPPN